MDRTESSFQAYALLIEKMNLEFEIEFTQTKVLKLFRVLGG